MKNNEKRFNLNLKFFIIGLFLFFSLGSVAQRNVTTIRINGETFKKSTIIDSLAEWMPKRDLKKADSCVQIIFNAIHRKDTAAEISGIKGLNAIINSEKYAAEPMRSVLSKNHPICCIFKSRCCVGPVEHPDDVIKVKQQDPSPIKS